MGEDTMIDEEVPEEEEVPEFEPPVLEKVDDVEEESAYVPKHGELSLLQVAERNMLDMVDGCLLEGDELEMQDDKGATPLILAVHHQFYEMTEFLLARCAYPNARKLNGETALHCTARHGSLPLMRLLLQHGALVETDGDGKTRALHLASQGNHDACVQLLLERGADTSMKNENAQTPLALTTSNNIKNLLQSTVTHRGNARHKLRLETAEIEVLRLAEEKRLRNEREASEKEWIETEDADRIKKAADEAQALIDTKESLIQEIATLKSEVARFQQEEAEREERRLEEEERLRLEAEKAAKKKSKGKKK